MLHDTIVRGMRAFRVVTRRGGACGCRSPPPMRTCQRSSRRSAPVQKPSHADRTMTIRINCEPRLPFQLKRRPCLVQLYSLIHECTGLGGRVASAPTRKAANSHRGSWLLRCLGQRGQDRCQCAAEAVRQHLTRSVQLASRTDCYQLLCPATRGRSLNSLSRRHASTG